MNFIAKKKKKIEEETVENGKIFLLLKRKAYQRDVLRSLRETKFIPVILKLVKRIINKNANPEKRKEKKKKENALERKRK